MQLNEKQQKKITKNSSLIDIEKRRGMESERLVEQLRKDLATAKDDLTRYYILNYLIEQIVQYSNLKFNYTHVYILKCRKFALPEVKTPEVPTKSEVGY